LKKLNGVLPSSQDSTLFDLKNNTEVKIAIEEIIREELDQYIAQAISLENFHKSL
jgi:hypothetical protein